ncbi:MAG: DUF3419 family protein [Candidatus Hydrogenedentes bacterium]|nr:DUF3419 family protein [Candidatus Hydrogenedentota bacterium]
MRRRDATAKRFTEVCYAQCWEDADVLIGALDIQPGQTCLSVASAGDNTLALLTKSPGRVIAVDHNPLQLHCLDLRMAAYREFDHASLLELMGSRPSTRRVDLYERCRRQLTPDARDFWDSHKPAIAAGIGTAGKFERYLALFRTRVLPWLLSEEAVSALAQSGSPASRERFYGRHVDTWRFRSAFRLFFSRLLMGRLGRHPAAFRFVEGSVASHLLMRLRHALTVLDPSDNPYLQWILQGRHPGALPCALRAEHFDAIRNNLDRVETRCVTVQECLKQLSDREIDGFNLSDIFEYLSEAETADLFDDIVRTGRRGGRVAYWNLLVPRSSPERLNGQLQPLEKAAAALHARDKTFFYSAFRLEGI